MRMRSGFGLRTSPRTDSANASRHSRKTSKCLVMAFSCAMSLAAAFSTTFEASSTTLSASAPTTSKTEVTPGSTKFAPALNTDLATTGARFFTKDPENFRAAALACLLRPALLATWLSMDAVKFNNGSDAKSFSHALNRRTVQPDSSRSCDQWSRRKVFPVPHRASILTTSGAALPLSTSRRKRPEIRFVRKSASVLRPSASTELRH